MSRDDVIKALKEAYQNGYSDGFTDACNLLRDATSGLVQSMEESLEEHTMVIDETVLGGEE